MSAGKDQQLEAISEVIDALVVQLGQLKHSPAKREEIAKQVVRLGGLYRAIRLGDDLFVQAR